MWPDPRSGPARLCGDTLKAVVSGFGNKDWTERDPGPRWAAA